MQLTQNVLVTTDFSKASELAIDAAAILAKQNGAKITLVHVWEPRGVLFGGEPGLQPGESIPVELEKTIHERLDGLAKEHLKGIDKVKTALVISPSAAKGIIDYAEKEGVDMIVIATHGRTGLRRMVIGSVAERVVRHAACPVLSLRSKLDE